MATGIETTGSIQGESPAGDVRARSSETACSCARADPCTSPANAITGDIALEENVGQVVLDANDVVGSIQANKNTGGLTITANTIGNGLQCQDNNPPPTGGGNAAEAEAGTVREPLTG